MWVTDLTHYLDEDGRLTPGRPGKLGKFFGRVAATATVFPPGRVIESAVPCRRRPGRKRCPGRLLIMRNEISSEIFWECPECRDGGVIHNWKGTVWDRREDANRLKSLRQLGHKLLKVCVSQEEFRELLQIPFFSRASQVIVAAAVMDGGQVALSATMEEFEHFAGYIAAEANHESNRRRQQVLDNVVRRIDQVVEKYWGE